MLTLVHVEDSSFSVLPPYAFTGSCQQQGLRTCANKCRQVPARGGPRDGAHGQTARCGGGEARACRAAARHCLR
eukprot:scaffold140143_cov19-Tisochrysis_lutea.AAC.2